MRAVDKPELSIVFLAEELSWAPLRYNYTTPTYTDVANNILQLHQPHDEGLDKFWVDFNVATSNMSLYTEDICDSGGSMAGEGDDMWESIIVKNDIVKEWSVTS